MSDKFPELTIVAKGSSGIEIRAPLPEAFDCREFTLRTDVPVSVFISPWFQFEPAKMNDYRLKLAHEIARRAMAHDELLKQVEELQKSLERERKVMDRRAETQDVTYRMWREDRARMGLPEDFSDIKDWPPEMKNGYDSGRT